MQQALVHYKDDKYVEYFLWGKNYYKTARHQSTEELLTSTGYSPDLIQLLCENYESWVLVFDERADTLFVGYGSESSGGSVIAHGDTAALSDWLSDVTFYTPRNPIGFVDCETWGSLFDSHSLGVFLRYLNDFSFIPTLSIYDVLRPAQTDRGTVYWYKFFLVDWL